MEINSVTCMDRISTPFLTMEDGVWRERRGFRDGQVRDFGEGGPHRLYRFNTPDQANLPALTGPALEPGVHLGEAMPDPAPATALLKSEGVRLSG